MMTEQEVKQLLIDTQAILEGHFLLTSGLHSPMYVCLLYTSPSPRDTR